LLSLLFVYGVPCPEWSEIHCKALTWLPLLIPGLCEWLVVFMLQLLVETSSGLYTGTILLILAITARSAPDDQSAFVRPGLLS